MDDRRHAARRKRTRVSSRCLGAFVALLAMLPSMGTNAAPPEPGTARIVAFGDSTTATAADWTPAITEVYAQCLPRTLAAHGVRAEVINAGIGDTTTRDGVLRFDRDVRSHAPQLVIIQFGINDSWIDADLGRTEPRLTREEFRNNLRYFIRTLREDGATTILMTPNPMRWGEPFYIELFTRKPGLLDTAQERGINALLDRYAQDVRDVAIEQDTPLVDVFTAFEDYGSQPGKSLDDLLLAGDGIHPNTAGQRLVCDLLTPRVAADLARMARP
jgi:lysophospholipase L1-like esterase